ncbi:glycosyltransferase [Parapedobacter defluvii]|nr:glycosyltransferase [Parapedobacter defluvii]
MKRVNTTEQSVPEGDYAIIVTAYEQTHMLPAVVASILRSKHTNYLIYIVADKCDVSTLHFADERVILLRPEQVLSSNTRSHFYAIQHFRRPHERLTIIDSDNLVDENYLHELDRSFNDGFLAVQGVRNAKNKNTMYACLDAARDLYYHFYDGKILFGVGSSATLAGSGMAFTVSLYRECLTQLDIRGAGFDKVLQFEILKRSKRIAFNQHAIVYDEKTAYTDQLVKQRSRWINTWFKYFRFGFSLMGKGILNANVNQLLFGFTLLRPPLFILLALSLVFFLINVFINIWVAIAWIVGILAFVGGFFLSLHHSEADKQIYASLKGIPLFIGYQLVSLVKARKANTISIATKHYERGETTK